MAVCKNLAIVILFAIIKRSSSTTICATNGDSCTYRVTCLYHPGTASNPTCNKDPNVTFVIASSIANIVTTSFFGATNFDTRVRAIEAANNTWMTIGTLAFRYYQKVKRIDLSGNVISEIQEEAFKTLVSLNHLNLSNNIISELYRKSFIITDSKNTDLETLDLSFNRITVISEEVFSYLPNLVTLHLENNRLKTLADNCFGSQKYLISLHLQHNYIGRLNVSLVTLKKLQYLDLSFNSLKTMSSYETNRLQALEKINISNNALQDFETNCFVQCLNLQSVDLSNNMITSAIQNMMFAGNIKLEYLNLYGNRIYDIEGNSFKHNQLTYLNLENNKISGEIKDNTFAGLENITNLDLSRQNITVLRKYAFVEMLNLLSLNLSRNHIYKVENASFINSSLNVLDLSYNNISNLDFMFCNTLNNLTEFYLNNNNLSVIKENTFQKQVLMTKLDISGNNLITIEQNSLPLQNLQYLTMINNNLKGVLQRDTISPAKYLRFLDLSYFNFTRIDHMTFVDMPVLARLNLSHNAIGIIESDNFRGMDNLYGIDISFNTLTDFQFNNSLLTNLKAAYLNNNKLTNISRIFPSACNILYLDISYNKFSDLSYVDNKLFPEIQTLHLTHNNIEYFNNPHTNTLAKLIDLGLSSNKLKNINLSYFKKLTIVDLSDNQLSVINNTFFNNIKLIQSMDLSRNSITDLPPGTFLYMENLKLLNLSSNYITKLRYGSLNGLNRTEILDVSNNRLESLDVNIFHECTELKTLVIDYNRIKTLDIERLVLVTQSKLKTLSLGGNPISCQEIIRNATLRDNSFYGLNKIEVTSIHKIYHEDNVHGIKCGDDDITTTIKIDTVIKENTNSSSLLVIVLCSVLIVILLGVGLCIYIRIRQRGRPRFLYRESRVHLGNSVELDNNDEYSVIN